MMPRLKDAFSAIELWILNGYAKRLPKNYNEERVGLEPTRAINPPVFKTGAIPLRFTNPLHLLGSNQAFWFQRPASYRLEENALGRFQF